MPQLEAPMGLALVVCDAIIEDKLTGKKTLVGLFDRVYALSFPCVHPAMAVFVSLTSARGRYPCEIVCRHADNATVAFAAKGNVSLEDPSQVVDLVFRLNGVRFPKPGTYWLHFLADEVPIMMRPMFVQAREAKGQAQPPPTPDADR
jgi:hypothetical protein